MTGPSALTLMLLAAGAGLAGQPSFRARTDLVRLDVLVTDDGRPVEGLKAADFTVRDNGVPQRVAAVTSMESVQLAVVLDMSGSMTGDRLALVRAATTDLLRQLTSRDTVAVLAFGSQPWLLASRGTSPGAAAEALGRLDASGSTSLVDALYAGIVEAGGESGPKLVLLMTDGRNNSSWLKVTDVLDIARRHETVVYPVSVGAIEAAIEPAHPRGNNPLPAAMGTDKAWRSGLSPQFRTGDARALLHVIAEETGGRPIDADWDRSLGSVFRRILDEYRQRYIVSFTPEGVASGDGWHTLEVRVKRRGVDVRTRTSYWSG